MSCGTSCSRPGARDPGRRRRVPPSEIGPLPPGRHSPEGFYRDSYDYATLTRVLLDPLSPGGSGRFRRAIFDVDADVVVDSPEEQAAPGSILLFDGIFLHRPELRGYWDFSIFLHVEWARNHRVRHHPEQASRRYSEGQANYLRECRPHERASVVIDNDDLARPFIVRATVRNLCGGSVRPVEFSGCE